MKVEIKVPEVGESITEGVIVEWFKASGDAVSKDEPLFELETDKITMQVPAEHAGTLTIGVEEGDVTIGQVVGHLDTDAAGQSVKSETPAVEQKEDVALEETPAAKDLLSPAARRIVEEEGIDASEIVGTGKDGRITKEDALKAVKKTKPDSEPKAAPSAASKNAAPTPMPKKPADPPAVIKTSEPKVKIASEPAKKVLVHERQTRKKMSSLRRRIADRLVGVQQNAAILTTFNEVDMSYVMNLRKKLQEGFVAKHGIKLGMMSFFAKAVVSALKAVPAVNAQIDGEEIIQNHYYDIGIAVGTDKGLVVPVLRDVDQKDVPMIEKEIADYGKRARERKLELSELSGGVFTISNGGVYGSLMSTPILNPPQSAILGMHGIKKRPVVLEDDSIVARPMMYLALSYDHRLIDGLEAVTFLKHIVEAIEVPERLLFDL